MVIKKTIKKEDIKEMPKVLFPGRIHLVQTPWEAEKAVTYLCLLYTSPSPRDRQKSRMPSSA